MTRYLLAVFAALLPAPLLAADVASVSVSPSAIEIKHHRHPHAIQVLGTTADGYSVDWDALEAAAENDHRRQVLRELRLIAGMAALHRTHAEEELAASGEQPAAAGSR